MPYANKAKQAEYQRKRKLSIRKWTAEYKEATPCHDCGLKYPYYVMQFDHVRGKKRKDVSRITSSKRVFLEEVLKCELVCANCHAVRTWRESHI